MLGHYMRLLVSHQPPASKFSWAHANSLYRLTARITIFLCMFQLIIAMETLLLQCSSPCWHSSLTTTVLWGTSTCPINWIISCEVYSYRPNFGTYTSIEIMRKPAHPHVLFCEELMWNKLSHCSGLTCQICRSHILCIIFTTVLFFMVTINSVYQYLTSSHQLSLLNIN